MTDEALIIVDLQNDYFPNRRWPLVCIKDAAANARLVLNYFQENDMALVHIRHEFSADNAPFFAPGSHDAQINELVLPKDGEPVVLKHYPNAFRDTNLKALLDSQDIKNSLFSAQ